MDEAPPAPPQGSRDRRRALHVPLRAGTARAHRRRARRNPVEPQKAGAQPPFPAHPSGDGRRRIAATRDPRHEQAGGRRAPAGAGVDRRVEAMAWLAIVVGWTEPGELLAGAADPRKRRSLTSSPNLSSRSSRRSQAKRSLPTPLRGATKSTPDPGSRLDDVGVLSRARLRAGHGSTAPGHHRHTRVTKARRQWSLRRLKHTGGRQPAGRADHGGRGPPACSSEVSSMRSVALVIGIVLAIARTKRSTTRSSAPGVSADGSHELAVGAVDANRFVSGWYCARAPRGARGDRLPWRRVGLGHRRGASIRPEPSQRGSATWISAQRCDPGKTTCNSPCAARSAG